MFIKKFGLRGTNRIKLIEKQPNHDDGTQQMSKRKGVNDD
jgi:hypothetical protein